MLLTIGPKYSELCPNIRRDVLKVGVWGPGSMGVIALRGVIDHPQLELSTSWCTAMPKRAATRRIVWNRAGRGVATEDPAAMLAGNAEVVVYAAGANLRPLEAVEDMVSILRAGKNVVSCSVVPLVFPEPSTRIHRFAAAGGTGRRWFFFTTGIDSGFANDVLPLVLTGVSRVSNRCG